MRNIVWRVLLWTGVLSLWRLCHRRAVTILMLHGVMDADPPTRWAPLRPQLSRRSFDCILGVLSKYYQFVSLEEAIAMLKGISPPRAHALVLTFDDGYRNNLTHAQPILAKYGAPATFFVVPGHIDTRRPFWFDRIDYALQQVPPQEREVQIGHRYVPIDGRSRRTLRASYSVLRDAAKALSDDRVMQDQLEALAAKLEEESGHRLAEFFEDDAWSGLMTWQDVRAARARGVGIGSHTVDHVRLGLVESAVAQDQIQRAREMIEAQVDEPCRYLCYPNGSYSQIVEDLARACGYEAAVTTEEGANWCGDNLMALRRIAFPDTEDVAKVIAQVSGLTIAVERLKARLQRLVLALVPHRKEDSGADA
ncbi:MAG: polysaccharide deacetylase family protein [Candidatus Binatia bacterium]